jgi:tetratricopeptide (TPR) repeat protein
MPRRVLLSLVSILFLSFPLLGAEIEWVKTLNDAKEAASRDGRFIVLDVSADWCPACRELARNVYTDAKFIAFSRSQVFMVVDAYKEREGQKMGQRFHVEVFPTILVLDSEGKEIDRLTGSSSASTLMENLQGIFDNPIPAEQLNERAKTSPDDPELQALAGRRAFDRDDFEKAQRFLTRALELNDSGDKTVVVPLLVDLIEASFKNGDFETSLQTIERLYGVDVSYRDVEWLMLRRARALTALDRHEEAYAALLELMKSQSARIRGEARDLIGDLPKKFRKDIEGLEKLHKKAEESLQKRKFEEARQQIEEILSTAPDDGRAHVQLAQVLFGLHAEAGAGPEARALLSRAYSELRRGRRLSNDDVGTYLTSLDLTFPFHGLRTKPNDSDACKDYEKAEKEFASEHYKQAVDRYWKVLKKDPDFGRAYLHLGDCYFLNGQVEDSLKFYLQAIQLNRKDAPAYRFAADALGKLGQGQKAWEMLLESVLADPDYPLAWRDLENGRRAGGKGLERHTSIVPLQLLIPPEGDEYESLLASIPAKTVPAWREYLNCKLQWRDEHKDDDPCFLPGAEEEKTCLGRTVEVWDRLKSADRLLKDDDLDFLRQLSIDEQLDAFVFLELFTEEYRPAFEAWKGRNRGRALRYLDDYVFGQAQAVARKGYNSSAIKAFNDGTSVHESDPVMALTLYRKALRQEPYMLPALKNASYLYFRQEKYEEALDCLRRWREVEPDSSQALHMTAFAYIQDEKYSEALPLLQRAAELEKDPDERAKIEENIRFCQYKIAE